MLVLISLVVSLIIIINNYYSLEDFDYDFLEDSDYDFLEEQKYKKEKEKERKIKEQFINKTIETKNFLININIKKMMEIEQKLKTYKKIINNKNSSSYEIWKAEGLSIKLREDWKKRFNHNKKLIKEIKTYTY